MKHGLLILVLAVGVVCLLFVYLNIRSRVIRREQEVLALHWTKVGEKEETSHHFISAYFDDRQIKSAGRPAVVVIGYAARVLQRSEQLHCYFEYADGSRTCLKAPVIQETVNCGKQREDEKLEPYNYICSVASNTKEELPVSVAIGRCHSLDTAPYLNMSDFIPLIINNHQNSSSDKKTTKKFGVCLHGPLIQDMQNDPTGEKILQNITNFIQMSQLLGAEEITMYASPSDLKDDIRKYLLDTYPGTIRMVEWKTFDNRRKNYFRLHYHGQIVLINDCIYRNMHRVKYLVMMDLDEMIIPVKHYNWLDMMTHLEKKQQKGHRVSASYNFVNTFFGFRTLPYPKVLQDCEEREALPYFTRGYQLLCNLKISVRMKLIIRPELVLTSVVHVVCETVPGYPKSIRVQTEIGVSAHYRNKILKTCEGSRSRVNKVAMKLAGNYSRMFCQ